MKKLLVLGAMALLPATAHATSLTFDINGGFTNRDNPGDYGDRVSATNADSTGVGAAAVGTYGVGAEGATPNVVVDYLGPDPSLWDFGYATLENVFFDDNDNGSAFGLTLTADAGFLVTLTSFDIGNFGSPITIPSIDILVDGLIAFSETNYALGTSTQSLMPNLTGGIIQLLFDPTGLGGSTDNIGIDNILFSQSVDPNTGGGGNPSTVPLPAGLPLLAAGLSVFGLVRRKAQI